MRLNPIPLPVFTTALKLCCKGGCFLQPPRSVVLQSFRSRSIMLAFIPFYGSPTRKSELGTAGSFSRWCYSVRDAGSTGGTHEKTYAESTEFRRWCERHRNQYYVPEWLLGVWEIAVDPNLGSRISNTCGGFTMTPEDLINELCHQAVLAPDERELEAALRELQSALQEHRDYLESVSADYLLSLPLAIRKRLGKLHESTAA
jgi:hypothetical protein